MSTIDCVAEKKTAEYCADAATKCINYCSTKFGKEVFAIVTDNEPKMTKLRDIISQSFPNIITYGCAAHYLNLVETEVAPKTAIGQILTVQKFFKNHHQPHGWLKEIGGKSPQIPVCTRWNSQAECVNTFIYNYQFYRQIIAEHGEEVDKNITKILNSVSLYR